jgi:NAD(P)-dependent dehydrogenase (short-subunit alcohol dehydrogenase family)
METLRTGQGGPGTPGVAVVTGGARGIGRGIAERLVARGHRVVVTDLDGDAARRTADEIGAVEGLAQDVRDEAGHRAVAERALAHGPLRVWCNNAGVGDDGTLEELSAEAVERLVGVNLLGVAWGMRAALEAFGPEGGEILNIGSLSAHGPVPGLSVYAATKAGVVSLSSSVAAETSDRVRVHVCCPDGVATALVAGMSDGGRAKALVHSGGGLLSVDEAADAAVGMLGTSRVVLTVPRWRGGMMRAGALAPGLVRRAQGLMVWQGRRRMRR